MIPQISKVAGCLLLCAIALAGSIPPTADRQYEWRSVAPMGSGCFPPNCDEGKFPMAIVPVVGPNGQLFSIGDRLVWTSYDGVRWKSTPKTDWDERYGMQFAFFAGRLWMFGGMRAWEDFRNDIWHSRDGVEWTQISKAAWSPRRDHNLVVFRDKLWLFGGAESSGRVNTPPSQILNDVWSSSDGLTWVRETTTAPWSTLDAKTTLVFKNRIWVIGVRSGVWSSSDGLVWERVTQAVPWQDRIGNGGLVYDGKMWIFGGRELNDVWSSADGKAWQLVFAKAPWSRRSASYSVVFNDRIWLFSGKTGREDSWDGEIWAMRAKGN